MFYEVVGGAIVPGLEAHGVAAEDAWKRRERPQRIDFLPGSLPVG